MNFKMHWPRRQLAYRIAAAVGTGILLRFVVGLTPVWWMVWIAPAPLLLLALHSNQREARWLVALAVLIGISGNFHYYRLVMPLAIVLAVLAAQTLLWIFIVLASRRVVLRYRTWWTALTYPLLWTAVDTLMAALLPDGNWGSLAYSQGDILPLLQITSLLGVAGLLFLVSLLPSSLALAIHFGREWKKGAIAYALTALLLAASLAYGLWRLQTQPEGEEVIFGLAAIDDAIETDTPAAKAASILSQYDSHVTALAEWGARIVVLPEKMGTLTPAQAGQWQQQLSALAARQHIWLEAGVAVDDGRSRVNLSWLFTPEGMLAANYQKHHMAPPEREFVPGTAYDLRAIDGRSYGLAICKDMHFAALGREYGIRQAAVMLVPAWDFYFDAWLEARTTLTRGVENGYAVVRSSREGLLTASDAYGRVVAETESRAMPGSVLLAKLRVSSRVTTLYTQTGDLFGWLCVAAAAMLLVIGRRNQTV